MPLFGARGGDEAEAEAPAEDPEEEESARPAAAPLVGDTRGHLILTLETLKFERLVLFSFDARVGSLHWLLFHCKIFEFVKVLKFLMGEFFAERITFLF